MSEFTKNKRKERGEFLVVVAVLAIVLLATGALSLFLGAVRIPAGELFLPDNLAILKLRIMRIILAISSGAALSVAGVIFQATLRNPLADPYLLGTSSGASLGAAAFIILGVGGTILLPVGAFLGAVLAIVLVYNLARFNNKVPVQTLILAGVVVGALFSSLLLLLISLAPHQRLHTAIWWLLGNLEIFDTRLLASVGAIAVIGIGVSFFFTSELNLISLGEEEAAHLGMRVERDKKVLFAIASLITGATVAACGLIGFVGLIVPHACRLLVGPNHRRLLPASIAAGAIFLLLCDSLSRVFFTRHVIPVGVVTALFGGPFFLVLLRRKRKIGFR